MRLPYRKHPYYQKDANKAEPCNKFIGRGSETSSTNFYATNLDPSIVNCHSYASTDIVLISVEGNRRGRLPFDKEELLLAIQAGVTFITDNRDHRSRPYNIGEREVALFLKSYGYGPIEYSKRAVWKRI